MFCRMCGAQISDHMSFCPKCGTKVIIKEQETPIPSVQQAPQMQMPQEPSVQPTPQMQMPQEPPVQPTPQESSVQPTPQMQQSQKPPVQPTPQPQQAPNPGKKNRTVIVIVILSVAVVALLAVLLWFLFLKDDKSDNSHSSGGGDLPAQSDILLPGADSSDEVTENDSPEDDITDLPAIDQETQEKGVEAPEIDLPEDQEAYEAYELVAGDFCFASGVGAWSTDLTLYPDGRFEGVYHDANMGETGEGYPNGTIYYCSFEGRFSEPQKIGENTYQMKIKSINLENSPGTSEIKDDILYQYTEPYGVADANYFELYLPGKKTSELSENYLSWAYLGWWGEEAPDTLPFAGIYNVKTGDGFIGETESDQTEPEEEKEEKKKKKKKTAAYILEFSSDREITKTDLKGLSFTELRIARNEIFARHGRMFEDSFLQDYFDSKAWYQNLSISKCAPNDFGQGVHSLSTLEMKNADMITQYTTDKMGRTDFYPDASYEVISNFDLGLSKADLQQALKQVEGYEWTEIRDKNIRKIKKAINRTVYSY